MFLDKAMNINYCLIASTRVVQKQNLKVMSIQMEQKGRYGLIYSDSNKAHSKVLNVT